MSSQNPFLTPLIRENPVTLHVLGVCAALAITNSLTSSLIMSVAMTIVLVISNAAISLIVTNCIVLGRAEACAMKHGVGTSILDALGNGLGYSIILVIVAIIRELFGNGSLMGYRILELVQDGGWFQPNEMLLLPPSAFFIIGFMVWVVRSWKPEQSEKPEFEPIPLPMEEERYPL